MKTERDPAGSAACRPSRGAGSALTCVLAVVLALGTALAPIRAPAHEMNLARYRVTAVADGLEVELTVPRTFAELRGDAGTIGWPAPCVERDRSLAPAGTLVRLTVRAHCPEAPASGATIRAPWGADGAVLTMDGTVTVLAAREGGVELPLPGAGPRGLLTVLTEYVQLGVQHILEGWDHLAFVLCLFLLTGGWGLLWLVTAFTVGHSVSLALAHLGVISVPVPPTEAIIALSIVFMAREAALAPADARTVDRRAVLVVVVFGLLHGLGFASVLGDLGVAASERVSGLLAFNFGVELGQLLFVALLAGLWTAARAFGAEPAARLTSLTLAGGVGAFWFCERFLGLLA